MLQTTSSGRLLICSRKSVSPGMEPWGTPALTGYSCEDFPFRTTRSRLLLRKKEIRLNIWTEDLNLWRRPACQTLSKALGISSVTARVAPDLLKALTILSDTAVTTSAVDREYLKPYWKSSKRPKYSRWSTVLLFRSFLKTLLKKTNRAVVFSCRPFPNIFTYRDHQWKLPTIWTRRFLQTLIGEFS